MKKVLIIVAAAIAATFSMTSCVETNESASVTALREAKVAQLQALAERAQAMADQARYQAMQDSIALAIKEGASAAELEALLAKYQYDLLDWQYQMQQKENEMIGNANAHIKNLYTEYSNAISDLNDLKTNLLTAQVNLSMANADLLEAQAFVAQETARQNKIIEEAQVKIEAYNTYAGVDRADIEAEYNALLLQLTMASSDRFAKQQLRHQALNDANRWIDDDYTLEIEYNQYNTNTIKGINRKENTVATLDAVYNILDTLLTEFGLEPNQSDFHIADSTDRLVYATEVYTRTLSFPTYDVLYSDYENAVSDLKADSIALADEIGVPSNATATPPVAATGAYSKLETAQSALDQYLENTAAADQDEQQIALLEKAVTDAQAELLSLQSELDEIKHNLEWLPELYVALEEANEAYQNELNTLDENELVVGYFNACVEYENASRAYAELDAQIAALRGMLYNGGQWEYVYDDNGNRIVEDFVYDPQANQYYYIYKMEYIGGSLVDIQALIEAEEEIIAEAEAAIEKLSQINSTFDPENPGDLSNNEVAAQYVINYLTEKIAQLEEQIALQEQIVASAKAALDAALSGEQEAA